METEFNDAFEKLNVLLKEAPNKIKELQDMAKANQPKSSRRVSINGSEAISTITEGGKVVIEFIDPKQAEGFYNGLELK